MCREQDDHKVYYGHVLPILGVETNPSGSPDNVDTLGRLYAFVSHLSRSNGGFLLERMDNGTSK